MTSTIIQPYCRKYNINIGCFDEPRVKPRNIREGNTALKLNNFHFCVNWKSDGISFIQAIEELKQYFKTVNNVLSDKHNKSFINFEHKP